MGSSVRTGSAVARGPRIGRFRKKRGVTRVPWRGTVRLVIRLLRVAAGVVFGIGKFSQHEAEVDSFRTYGLPAPDAFVYAIGVVEIAGGLMLIAGLLVWLAAL